MALPWGATGTPKAPNRHPKACHGRANWHHFGANWPCQLKLKNRAQLAHPFWCPKCLLVTLSGDHLKRKHQGNKAFWSFRPSKLALSLSHFRDHFDPFQAPVWTIPPRPFQNQLIQNWIIGVIIRLGVIITTGGGCWQRPARTHRGTASQSCSRRPAVRTSLSA